MVVLSVSFHRYWLCRLLSFDKERVWIVFQSRIVFHVRIFWEEAGRGTKKLFCELMRRLGRWLLSLFPVPLPLPPSPSFPLFLHSLSREKTKPCLIVVWFISWWCGYQFLSLTLPLTLAPSLSFPHTLPLHFAPYLSSFPLSCKQITAMTHCCLVFNQCSTSTTKFEEAQRKIFVWRWVGHGEQRFSHWLALSPTHSLSLTDSLPCPIHSVLSADSSHGWLLFGFSVMVPWVSTSPSCNSLSHTLLSLAHTHTLFLVLPLYFTTYSNGWLLFGFQSW